MRSTGPLSVVDGGNPSAVDGDGSSDLLVGRGRELAAITAAMTTVRRGVQRAVHLVGEPGIGKTSLAEHVSSLASAQGWTVVWGRAWHAGGMPPYWTWQQALGSLVRSTTVVTRCDAGTLALLVDLVPKLAGSAGPAAAPAADPSQARAMLHRAVVQILATAASEQPLLVVLDDLHEADTASQVLTGVVCRSLPNSPLLVLSTQRHVARPVGAQDTLEALTRQGMVIPIGPLDQSAVSAQATAMTGRECTADDGEWLYSASGGNPFFVEQLVRWSPVGALRPPGKLAVSAAVHQVVRERLAVLGADTRRLITVAAVAGEEVDEQVLAAVTGLSAEDFFGAVEQAVGAGILWRRASEHPACGFVHALLREAAAGAVDAHLRRELHERVAVALEALPTRPDRLAEIADHRRAALPVGAAEMMVEVTVAAAAAAARVFAHEAMIAQCTAGLSAIGPYGSAPQAQGWRARLLGVLGQAQADAGDPARARETLVEAQTLALGIGNVVLAGSVTILIPRITSYGIPDRELESLLTVALNAVDDADPVLRVRLLARRAVIAEDAQDRQVHGDQAVQAARQLGDERLLAEVLSGWLVVSWAPETSQERLDTGAQIIELAIRTGDVRRELDGRMWRLIALLEFGRIAEAEAELSRYELLAERSNQPEFLFFARSRRSTLAALRGRFDEAERLTRSAHDLAVEAGLPDAKMVFVSQLMYIAWLRGGDLVDAVLDLCAEMGFTPMLRASVLLAGGRAAEARALLPNMLTLPPPQTVPGSMRWMFLVLVAEMSYQLGDVAAARLTYDQLTAHHDKFVVASGAVGCMGAASRLLGLCALTLDRPDDAIRWLHEAVAANDRAGAAPFLAKAQVTLAVALCRRTGPGDTNQARQLLSDAAALAADLQMAPLTQEIAVLTRDDSGPRSRRARLRREGADWILIFDGRSTRLRHSKGLTQLAALLDNPGREITAVELAGGIQSSTRTSVLDDAAKRAYRLRLADLDKGLDQADARGDTRTTERLETERAALVAELKRATGLTGRSRAFSDEAEHARVNVTRTVRQALDRILTADPEAGRHLLASIRTGIRCLYQPDH